MRSDAVLATIRRHERELRAEGIARLTLFGSVARGEGRPDSDIDLLAAFDPGRDLSILDILRLERRLGELLDHPVDLVEEGTLRPHIGPDAERDGVRAF